MPYNLRSSRDGSSEPQGRNDTTNVMDERTGGSQDSGRTPTSDLEGVIKTQGEKLERLFRMFNEVLSKVSPRGEDHSGTQVGSHGERSNGDRGSAGRTQRGNTLERGGLSHPENSMKHKNVSAPSGSSTIPAEVHSRTQTRHEDVSPFTEDRGNVAGSIQQESSPRRGRVSHQDSSREREERASRPLSRSSAISAENVLCANRHRVVCLILDQCRPELCDTCRPGRSTSKKGIGSKRSSLYRRDRGRKHEERAHLSPSRSLAVSRELPTTHRRLRDAYPLNRKPLRFDLSTWICLNCNERGHRTRQCDQPLDPTRVKANRLALKAKREQSQADSENSHQAEGEARALGANSAAITTSIAEGAPIAAMSARIHPAREGAVGS